MTTLKMCVSDWIKVRDNPIQRDTERHAQKAKHLLTPLPTHAIVFAAKLPNGDLIKLDGHTRALLWKRNQAKHPPHVDVNVIPVESIERAIELYKTFDSRDALETATDKVSGGFRQAGFKPESGLLSSGSITSALKLAWVGVHGWAMEKRARDVYAMVDEFSAEILALDELGLGKGAAPSGVIAAFILSYRKHDVAILPFWRGVFADGGTKQDGEMDAIEAVCRLMLERRGSYGGKAGTDLCARALMAVEKWLNGEMLVIAPRPVDITSYIDRPSRAPKFQLIKKAKRAAA